MLAEVIIDFGCGRITLKISKRMTIQGYKIQEGREEEGNHRNCIRDQRLKG